MHLPRRRFYTDYTIEYMNLPWWRLYTDYTIVYMNLPWDAFYTDNTIEYKIFLKSVLCLLVLREFEMCYDISLLYSYLDFWLITIRNNWNR